ncbi:PAS domain S-box protein [Geomonas nitrogeniifigens]|uniref:PAS domain-containing hybrid sensor histidine kinase/response regulator n=1 Tax=Geomonas diazotrophica TaxID=2843197 RepID=UPI001C2CBB13|nr:PAS domain-containing sensor histidine kinase [Geomonas nitrogeniifigens]QXE88607.1 PAS domain S-box protein [Geomonas nitrogeniifigens]
MTGSEKQTVHFTANCTVLLAFFVALFFPVGYFAISYQYAVGSLETEAEINARIISGLGDLEPASWHSEAHRLDALLSHRGDPAQKEKHRILDSVGSELAASGYDPEAPVIQRSHPVLYGKQVIGSVEISRSLRPILKKSLLVTVMGLSIGLIVFILLPFRAINRANRQLQDSYNFLRKVMESSANALIVLKLDGTIGMVNGRCTETSGYTPEELHGRDIPGLVDPESRDMVLGQLHLVASGAADIVKFEADLVRKDGGTVTIACGATPVYQEGRIAGTVLSVENITERRAAVEALKSAKEYTENLIQAACVMILGLDLKGEVTLINRTGEEMTGYSQEELTGKNWFDTVMGAEAFFKMCGGSQLANDDGMNAFEGQIVTKAGAMRTISWRNSAIVEKGVRIGTLCFGIDITEHRKIEAQLRHSQKMESIGQLAGGVAHDFNNMLSVMLGYAQLSLLEAPEATPLRLYLQEIIKAGERSRDMVRKLLAFSRKEIISPRAVNLNEHCLETEKTLSRLIGEEVRFGFAPDPALWTVKIDPSQVDQILMNLAVNARDAMPDGGMLTIKTENVIVDEPFCDYRLDAKPGSYACLSVVDTGTGMDRELIKRIFEPFFTTKEMGRGTGLGLATVYGIVTQNGGFVDVESEPGSGTTFRIYLPRMSGESEPPAQILPGTLSGTGTVLVVEDDDMLRAMATQMLEKIGYQVIQAATPHAALCICKETDTDIDLVLSDVIMPEMNGLEMARGMAVLRPDTKVLFMTGYSSEIIAKRGIIADREMHYIQKPFDMEGLHAKIMEMRTAC